MFISKCEYKGRNCELDIVKWLLITLEFQK